MRAVRLDSGGQARLVDVPTPALGPEDVLVQVLAAGVCHTDLHLLDDVKAGRREPLVPGHEIAGRVAKVGPDVYAVSVGDFVGVHFEQPCGTCRHCRRKATNLCREGHSLGFDVPGGYAEFVKARQNTLLVFPKDLEPTAAAPLACSGATAYRVVKTLGQAREGDVVVVIGAGGVGLSAVQIARSEQARVLAVDVRQEARKAAEDVGAERAVSPEDARAALRDLTKDEGADVVADLVGDRETFDLGRSLLGYGGRFVAVAVKEDPVSVSAADLVVGGKAYLGAYSSTMAEFARVVRLAEAGLLRPVVSRRAKLADAPQVLADLAAGKIVGRAVLEPGRK